MQKWQNEKVFSVEKTTSPYYNLYHHSKFLSLSSDCKKTIWIQSYLPENKYFQQKSKTQCNIDQARFWRAYMTVFFEILGK